MMIRVRKGFFLGSWSFLVLLLVFSATPGSAAVKSVSDGIEFSYYAPGATQVFLAGSFNGWNATQLPLTNDGKGNWTIVHSLDAGKHEYKFVVDGAWFADPENPDTQPDPYGGANSLANVGDDGKLVATAAAGVEVRPLSNTALNARIFLAGRYLTQYRLVKNTAFSIPSGDSALTGQDGRYRLQRPSQHVDLNFHTSVSEVVDAYSRLRLDNEENIIQNNISGFLDEASLDVHPDDFHVIGYWDMELFTLGDPIGLGGDVDLPGTLLDDHLDAGKGSTGALFLADPWGIHFQGYFANVHNLDYYNDPLLFDDTGRDRFGLRFSKRFGALELGAPAYLERELIWMDFGEVVGLTETGMPALDTYLADSDDPSTWYEFERRHNQYGFDVTYWLRDDRAWVSLEWLYGDRRQAFVTGNDSGDNSENGAIDVPVLDRALNTWHASVDLKLGETSTLNVEHTTIDMSGAEALESELAHRFLPQSEANKRTYFEIQDSPSQTRHDYSEATWRWDNGARRHLLWLQRVAQQDDFAAVGQTDPQDTTATSRESISWIVSGSTRLGQPDNRLGQFELEAAINLTDIDVTAYDGTTLEIITRYERNVSPKLAVVADVRYIEFNTSTSGGTVADPSSVIENFWAPYGGLRYRPNPKVEVVLAYGIDPLEFGIDYQGRHIGRWWYRQQYLFANPDASPVDAEQSLADARIFGLRAQFTF
ncbi:MAG: glycogen-binding domain-containing protein [bacterium]